MTRIVLILGLGSGLTSCGYEPVYDCGRSTGLHVRLVRTLVVDAIAADEVTAGAREELARRGAYVAGDGWPRAEIEVLRADESSEGIAAESDQPVARATGVGIVARAWVVASEGAPPQVDTGDVRTRDVFAADGNARLRGPLNLGSRAFHDADAFRAAARRLGQKLARRLLGEPATSEEAAERP